MMNSIGWRRMSWLAIVLSSLLMRFVFTPQTKADVVWLKGQAEPTFGIILSFTDSELELEEWLDESKQFEVHKFPRSEIEEIFRNINKQRLESLDPGQPEAYATYCEELASHSRDPVAANLAVRLALIVSSHPDSNVSQSGLRLLIGVARSEDERQRFLQLARLRGLEFVEKKITSGAGLKIDPNSIVLQLIVALRQGKQEIATALLENAGLESELKAIDSSIGLPEFQRLSRLQQLPPRSLTELVKLELQLRTRASSSRSEANDWAAQSNLDPRGQFEIPQLETITEFDPAASIYRAGNWIIPPVR